MVGIEMADLQPRMVNFGAKASIEAHSHALKETCMTRLFVNTELVWDFIRQPE